MKWYEGGLENPLVPLQWSPSAADAVALLDDADAVALLGDADAQALADGPADAVALLLVLSVLW